MDWGGARFTIRIDSRVSQGSHRRRLWVSLRTRGFRHPKVLNAVSNAFPT